MKIVSDTARSFRTMKPEWYKLSRKLAATTILLGIHRSLLFMTQRTSALPTHEQETQRQFSHPYLSLPLEHYLFVKRLLDVVLASILLVCLSPILLVIALLIKLDSPGPAIFAQERVGSRITSKDRKRSWQ